MWVLKSRTNIALITGIILMLSLIAVWYVRGGPWYVEPVPTVSPLLLSDLENLNATATMEGRLAGDFFCADYCGEGEVPILIEAHVYTITNYTIRLQSEKAIDLTNPVSTQWRSISKPDVLLGEKSHLLSWKDNDKDGKLGPSDQIQMNKTEPAPVGPRWCDVQEVEYGAVCNITVTVDVTEDNIILRIETNIARADTIRLKNATAIDLENPVCTQWSADCTLGGKDWQKYHLLSWKDEDKDGKLSSSDRIKVNVTEKGGKGFQLEPRWCDVQEVEYGAVYYVSITNETVPDLSGNSTYVFNKLTRENAPDALEEYPDKNRTGYDPFYPLRLKADKDIHNVWLDNLNVTATLEFKDSIVEDGVTLYKYFVNETITKDTDVGAGPGIHTFINTKTVLIEPLSGIPVYTENEMVKVVKGSLELLHLTYKDREPDLATARLAHGAMELLEFDKQVKGWILGAIVVILTVAFIFNTRSLARRIPPQAKT